MGTGRHKVWKVAGRLGPRRGWNWQCWCHRYPNPIPGPDPVVWVNWTCASRIAVAGLSRPLCCGGLPLVERR